jgi:hypothetical protein
MKRARWLLWATLLALPATAGAAPQERSTLRFPLTLNGRVTIANVQGSIWVAGWDRAEAEVTVVKSAADSDANLDDATVAVNSQPDSLELRTLYAADTAEPVRVDYRLRVPRQALLASLHTVNGDIVVQDVEGPLEARTLNGAIEGRGVSDNVSARCLNGDVRIALRERPEADDRLQLETVNGNVLLLVPAETHADFEFSTVAGWIESSLPTTASETSAEGEWRARMGRGGARIRLRTIRGNIQLAESTGVF